MENRAFSFKLSGCLDFGFKGSRGRNAEGPKEKTKGGEV